MRRKTSRWFVYALTQLVELKNGETFNGHLVACDNFMNITLKEVYQTSSVRPYANAERRAVLEDGRVLYQGQHGRSRVCLTQIKYCRVADALIDAVRESEEHARKQRQAAAGHGQHARGRNDGGRGRGRGRGQRT